LLSTVYSTQGVNMLCCVGLIAGMSVGQSLGGPWTYIAPAAGFGIGFLGDMKLMKGMHKKAAQPDAAPVASPTPDTTSLGSAGQNTVRPASQLASQGELTPNLARSVAGGA